VFDHYGGAEMAALITQCEHGSYHVNPEFGIVEILRNGQPVSVGELGEIVATGFINPIMPLIRYRTGDMATLAASGCECRREGFPVIERIEGRMDDYIVTPEGYMVGRLDPIFKSVDSILETRLVQDEPDHVRIELVAGSSYSSDQGNVLVEELRKRVGPTMRMDVHLVPSIPRTAGGKLRMVVNETLRS
jgi:phenylacetate-CoA ligase